MRSIDSWLVDEDIRIIGVDLDTEFLESATALEESMFSVNNQLCRGGKENEGIVAQNNLIFFFMVETAGAGMCGDVRKQNHIMFPEGYGIDIDEGEYLNIHAYGECSAIGSMTPAIFATALVYYVER